MSTFRSAFAKATVQALLSITVALVASAGFLLDKISGENYLVIVVMAFAWAFRTPSS